MSCYEEDLLKDSTPFVERCYVCVYWDKGKDKCEKCFGVRAGKPFQYKNFKKDKKK